MSNKTLTPGTHLYLVGYARKVGPNNTIKVKGRSEKEALANAKNTTKTGINFYILKRL